MEGKIALVTGSAKGLGSHIAKELARNGCIVAINYFSSEEDAAATLKELEKINSQCVKIKADVTKPEDVDKMFSVIKEKYGKLDILVNNVGNFIYKPITETKDEEFKSTIENNLFSAFYCCRRALGMMEGGSVINIGAMGCDRLTVRKMTTPYYIAKTGLWLLTKALAFEDRKNRINMISPGIMESSVVKPEKSVVVNFNDISNAVMLLLSQETKKISGANIEVTGGWILGAE
jgi:3-oxoacyl-[acyl-carrier protein] reductase